MMVLFRSPSFREIGTANANRSIFVGLCRDLLEPSDPDVRSRDNSKRIYLKWEADHCN
jgi:hypothetical protein